MVVEVGVVGWEPLPPSGLLGIGSVQPSAPALAWTGKELLVAGVEDRRRGGEVWRGSRAFDASAGEWRVIRDPPTDDALWGTGFWSGREMLVWRYPPICEDPRQQGLAYDPETDVWRLLPPRPVNDCGGDVAWVSGKMFVRAGGSGPFSPSSNVASLYDPVTDRWTSVPAAPVAPRQASAVTVDEGRVFVWGGSDFNGAASDGAIYDVAENVWEPVGRAPISTRYGSGAVWTEKEFIVWSGMHPTKTNPRRIVRDGAAYEPATQTWRRIATAPTSLASPMVWVGDEVITWWAGSEYEPKASCLGYRPEDDTWRLVPDDGAAPQGPGVWTGTELYVWAPRGPGHDVAVYRPGTRQSSLG